MKKAFCLIFCLLIIPFNALGFSAERYCVIDKDTGRIFLSSRENEKAGMASTTKIMTALVALENSSPDEIVTVSKKASYTEGSSLYLKEGETIKMIDLVYGLMLNSGNDAAVAIAEHISGNEEDFALLMTETAHKIGAKNTNFINPNGLSDENHYTTAYDLALITAEALKNKDFAEIVKTKSRTCNTVNTNRTLYFTNHNRLLNSLEGCTGVKTGFTKATGRCLVSSVEKNGFGAICVTLNAPDDWNDHKQMFDFVFDNFSKTNIIKKGSVVKSYQTEAKENGGVLDLVIEDDVDIVTKPTDKVFMDITSLPDKISLPVKKGDSLGDAQFFLNDQLVMTKKLVSWQNLNKPEISDEETLGKRFFEIFKIWVGIFN